MIKVVVTKKDIQKALEERDKTPRSSYCPISQSFLRRLRKGCAVTTGVNVVIVHDLRAPLGKAFAYPLPGVAEEFVRNFDRFCSNMDDFKVSVPEPKPLTFTLPDTSQDAEVKELLLK